MTLKEAFKLIQDGHCPLVESISLYNKEEQVTELLATIGNDQGIKELYILDISQSDLEKLLHEKDKTVVASAVYTILNNSLKEFELDKYV